MREGGFRHVRVNLQAFAHMDVQNKLDTKWLSTLDKVMHEASMAGLDAILDERDYRPCGSDTDTCRTKIMAFWQQVAPRYKDAPAGVMFEILNEPNRALDATRWNALLAKALGVIRSTNPARIVIVGPANSSNLKSLAQLMLPDTDRNLLVTVHYYNPFPFTRQGATWTTPSREKLVGISWGSAANRAAIETDFDNIATWAKDHHRPILIEEFGADDKAQMDMRAAWISAVAKAAERNGLAWTWWQFDSSFDLYDIKANQWVAPLKDALISSGP
ncbi:MAG: glycoside hydrolase family 5 protein [Rhizobium sp.]